jgi:cell division protein FtsN
MMQRRSEAMIGFILGVLVGLAAALAVAVFVTKVPIPFMNKSHSRSVTQDAAEAQKNKDWDPNAALQGKNPVRPPVALGNTTAASAAAGKTPQAAVGQTGREVRSEMKVVPATQATAAAADPLGDLARVRASAATPAANPTVAPKVSSGQAADPFTYFVQAGAFRTAEDAEAQRAKLSLLGAEAKVTEREQSGRTVFRVRVGPFERKEDADRSKEKLDAGGLETALVRVQR